VTFADKAQAALSAAGALQKAGTALSTAEGAASTGNGGLIGGISGAIQAAQARALPFARPACAAHTAQAPACGSPRAHLHAACVARRARKRQPLAPNWAGAEPALV